LKVEKLNQKFTSACPRHVISYTHATSKVCGDRLSYSGMIALGELGKLRQRASDKLDQRAMNRANER
jgi:hypothetical protein